MVLVLVAAAVGYFSVRAMSNNNSSIKASGTIEAVNVNVSPELSGKIKDVLVNEGQTVKTGDPLLRLDDSLLTAQSAVASAQVDLAKAALATAQNHYDQTLQNALTLEGSTTAKDWHLSAPYQFNQPLWYFSQSEQITSAQAEVDAAQKSLQDAQANLQNVISDLNNSDFLTAEKKLADARAAFLVAQDVKTAADNVVQGGGVQKAGDANYNSASDDLRKAQEAYNALLKSNAANNIENARGKVVVAQQRYDLAYSHLLALETGAHSPAVAAASKALDQAKVALSQAEANLSMLNTQITKLIVYSPIDGVILTRSVEPGEFVQAGSVALTVANINQLTITVYVPENQYGQISLGQKATLNVDSFPGTPFNAEVTQIANQAEFTPRNVQTAEGRATTVFAIKLTVSDQDSKLKPGMPADLIFALK